jgi:hypothetical protein
MDLVNQRLGGKGALAMDSLCAVGLGAAFFFVFLAVQWNFSAFLLSKSADNWFFAGGRQWPYFIPASEWRGRFWGIMSNQWLNTTSATITLIYAIVSARIGLLVANWMGRVQR